MQDDGPVMMAFALVGAARQDFGSVKLENLAEHVTVALNNDQWIRLGFYDWGYRQSVQFWPKKVEDEEGFQRTSMKAFSGEIGQIGAANFPACLVISEHDGKTDAVVTWVITAVHRLRTDED